jgi:hypothetical protein
MYKYILNYLNTIYRACKRFVSDKTTTGESQKVQNGQSVSIDWSRDVVIDKSFAY